MATWTQISSIGNGAIVQAQGLKNFRVLYAPSQPADGTHEGSFLISNELGVVKMPEISGMMLWGVGDYSSTEIN